MMDHEYAGALVVTAPVHVRETPSLNGFFARSLGRSSYGKTPEEAIAGLGAGFRADGCTVDARILEQSADD